MQPLQRVRDRAQILERFALRNARGVDEIDRLVEPRPGPGRRLVEGRKNRWLRSCVTTIRYLTGYLQPVSIRNCSGVKKRLLLRQGRRPKMETLILVLVVFSAVLVLGALASVFGADSRDGVNGDPFGLTVGAPR